jgi:hypothetical protein
VDTAYQLGFERQEDAPGVRINTDEATSAPPQDAQFEVDPFADE